VLILYLPTDCITIGAIQLLPSQPIPLTVTYTIWIPFPESKLHIESKPSLSCAFLKDPTSHVLAHIQSNQSRRTPKHSMSKVAKEINGVTSVPLPGNISTCVRYINPKERPRHKHFFVLVPRCYKTIKSNR